MSCSLYISADNIDRNEKYFYCKNVLMALFYDERPLSRIDVYQIT